MLYEVITMEVVCVLRGGVSSAGEATEKEVSAHSIKASKVVLSLLFYHLRNMYFSHRKVMYALFFGVCVLTNPFIYLTKEIGW